MNQLQKIEQRLAPLKNALLNHRIYGEIDRVDVLRLFMEHHVFAVWDFMSLLKVLQRRICCVEVPWVPPADPQACHFINEIVLAEESDDDGRGGIASHFELYHRSMKQCGASTTGIDGLLCDLRRGIPVLTALASPTVPVAARHFVQETFKIIGSGDLCAIASAFTYGREDLLPDVFQRVVDKLNMEAGGQLEYFQYYLQRHIGLDGDEHGPIATRLLQSLCGADDALWEKAEQAAVDCLLARQELWTGIYDAISSKGASLGNLDPAAPAPQ
ncbi:MAG: DUF3050 domain-containing protein [Planctomycetota bacterium]|nr:DUF3050 domain-containing protein [Planctomycetota bacterium]